jgi:hypothetical protein
MFPQKVVIDLDGKDAEHMGVVRIPCIEPVRLYNLNIDVPPEMQNRYAPQENLMYMKQARKTIDRSIIPNKIKIIREKTQEGINPADDFLNLDVEAAARIELLSEIQSTQDLIVMDQGIQGEQVITEVSNQRPPKQDFRKQFEKIKNMRLNQ